MKIDFKAGGDILKDPSEAIVIPVNCRGIAGKGLAKEWKLRFPKAYKLYQTFCLEGSLVTGIILPTQEKGKWFLCFPTKEDWRDPSKLEYIKSGMELLVGMVIPSLKIRSVAIPALGCGLGGLRWEDVSQIIVEEFEAAEEYDTIVNLEVTIYDPR